MLIRRFAVAALLAAGPPAWAQSPAAAPGPSVTAEGAWARATPPGAATGAVYLTLLSPTGDRLVGVSTASAAKADVHETTMDGTVMRMREVSNGVTLPAGQPVTLQPGGLHIMLTGLAGPLKRGETVRLRLRFATAAPVEVAAPILPIGSAGPAGSASPAAAMPGMHH